MPVVYDELRRIAARYIGRERPGQTLQATGLVNEAFVRMAAERTREFQNRTHFLANAALSMRQILVQRARGKRAAKRDAGGRQVTLNDLSAPPSAVRPEFERADPDRPGDVDVIALDQALNRLVEFETGTTNIVPGLAESWTAAADGLSYTF